jgi:hypothetical protein
MEAWMCDKLSKKEEGGRPPIFIVCACMDEKLEPGFARTPYALPSCSVNITVGAVFKKHNIIL